MPKFLTLLLGACTVAGCGTMKVPDDQATVRVGFDFARRHACGEGPYSMKLTEMSHVSPAMQLDNLPRDTREVKIEMVDLDLLTFKHGGDTVAASGTSTTLPEGTLKHWMGPCPPTGHDHRYEMRVEALDGQGQTLAAGKAQRSCCTQFEGR